MTPINFSSCDPSKPDSWIRRSLAVLALCLAIPTQVSSQCSEPIPDLPPGLFNKDLIYSRYPTDPKYSNWETLPDIARINGKSLEANLVIERLGIGYVKEVYNCTDSPEICIAHQPKVSPDASRAVFTVCRGDRNTNFEIFVAGQKTGMFEFAYNECELWLHDFKTGENQQVTDGHIDQTPEWCGTDCLLFASDRQGFYARMAWNGPAYECRYDGRKTACKSLHIWQMRLTPDNNPVNLVNLTPHEMMAWGPAKLSNGDVLYLGWEGDGERFGTLDGRAKYMTSQNPWWVKRMGPNGENSESDINAHGGPTFIMRNPEVPYTGGEAATEIRGSRHFLEIVVGWIMGTNYYRGNQGGSLGILLRYPDNEGEGTLYASKLDAAVTKSDKIGSGRYVPTGFEILTKWANDQDSHTPKRNAQGVALGRAGYPARSTECKYTYVNVDGWRYGVALFDRANLDYLKTDEVAGLEIHCAKVWEITDKFDKDQTQCIAGCSPDWQVFDQQEVATYEELMGVPFPETPPYPYTEGETATLRVVDLYASETYPIPGAPEFYKERWQGNAVDDLPERIKSLQITEVKPWTTQPTRPGYFGFGKTYTGHPRSDTNGCLEMTVPCETSLVFKGADGKGETVAEDLTEHSFQCGEVVTCHGCHDGHSEERQAELGATPEQRWADQCETKGQQAIN